ncbi:MULTISPECIES: tetratricopeptide repeat protein, partial [Nostoc]|nr:hypothetical protein [Nostoc sp. FACHB-857]MBD2739688.1 hypothetical protein [Nostoc paludosum FACHB-159]
MAEKEYRLAIKYSNNKATNAINNLARLKNLQEKYSEAVQLAIEGLKNTLDSDTQLKAALYKNLGWARLMQKDYFQADKNLQKAFELNSQRVDVYCLLAKTKEALGQLDYANSYWEMCLLARTDGEYLPEIQKSGLFHSKCRQYMVRCSANSILMHLSHVSNRNYRSLR